MICIVCASHSPLSVKIMGSYLYLTYTITLTVFFFQIKAFTDKDKDTTLSPTSFEQVEEAEFVLMIRMRCVCL